VSEAAVVLILLGLITETALAIACYRVAEARGFNARMWAVIGFFTGIFGLVAVCLVRGPEHPDEEDAQA
jgi:hypothetical protein